MAISESDFKSAPEVKAVSVSRYFDASTLKTKITVSYSIDDNPKEYDQIALTDEFLHNMTVSEVQLDILQAFDKAWDKKHPQVRKQLLAHLHGALTKEYNDSKNWSTKFGGEHNKPKYHPGGLVTSTSKVDWTNASLYVGSATVVSDGTINGKSVDTLSFQLPAIDTMVAYPCKKDAKCEYGKRSAPLREIIMHLNDSEHWTRESIADWIDALHDKGIINAEFQVPDNRTDEQKIKDKLLEKYSEASLDDWKKLGYTMDELSVATVNASAALSKFGEATEPLAEWEKELLYGNQDEE